MTAIAFPPEAADQHSFGYDLLDRLSSATLGATTVSLAYSYDATGNRTQEVRNGAVSQYVNSGTTNRLQSLSGATTRSMSYNASGSLISDRGITFTYDGRERLVATGSTAYYVSGLEQRIEKAGPGANAPGGVRQFLYDEHGHLLGEYDAGGGAPIAEHVYLGDWPVGLMQGSMIYYVHPDQLGAPRVVTRATDNQTMWAWQREPFGSGAIQTVDGFEYNLRFPGQYYDAESGLHYNYFRDYDPSVGRYVESDPIGLKGGTNAYAYALGRPIAEADATGLAVWQCFRSMHWIPIGNHTYFFDDKTNRCCGNPGWGSNVRNPLAKCKERGLAKDVCVYISSSDSDAEKLLKCCDEKSNPWTYFPGIADCQNTADHCIRSIGMAPALTPVENRYRVCDSCRQTPNNPSRPPLF